jgi:pyochelin biosynthesis protein PchD
MTGIKSPIEGVIYHPPFESADYLASGAWVDQTVGDALRAQAAATPDKLVYISDERSIDYRIFDEETERLAAALLKLGMRTGDRAIFQMGTTIDTAIALLACYKAGIVPVCAVPQHRELEIGQLMKQARATGYFVQADFSPFDLVGFATKMIEQSVAGKYLIVARDTEPAPGGVASSMNALIDDMPLAEARRILADVPLGYGDVLAFQLSGGTTGVPKIIPRFNAEYLTHSAAWMKQYRITDASRIIWSLPLLHNAGQLYALIPAVAKGVTTVLMPKVDVKRMLELIEAHRVTHALSIGPIAPQMVAYSDIDKHDLSSLQLFATMSRSDALEAHIGVPCSNLYGITEGLLMGLPADAPAFARHHTQGASGSPFDKIKLLVPETEQPVPLGQMGEFCFKGPSTLPGFFEAPEANAKAYTSDGYYRTGDMMTRHEIDGVVCYAFEGRLRDNVNRGGEKIGCEEVEGFVSMHPAVADAKLAGFLIGHGLAKYKCPERIEIIESFPLTRVGKLDKPALKKMIAAIIEEESKP